MPKLRLPLEMDEYHRVTAISAARGVSAFAAAVDIWQLGLAAAEAGWRPQEALELQLVTAGAAESAA